METRNNEDRPRKSTKSIQYETESEPGSEVESEAEPIPVKKSKKPIKNEEIDLVPEKKKRVLTEKQKAGLAIARKKAREVLKEKSDLTRRRKDMKKEKMLLKKLELERDLAKHENYKKQLITEAGLVPTETTKVRKKRTTKDSDDETEFDNEKNEILELEERLSKLKTSTKKLKKKIKEPEPESEPESEPEPEPEIKTKKPLFLERSKPKTPIIKKNDSVIKDSDRFKPNNATAPNKTNDTEINRQIQSLFPMYQF
jgi:hypothetical protein